MVSSLDIAWAAGIYEGEGSCRRAIYKQESDATGKWKRTDKVAVIQKDTEILYRLKNLFGGHIGRSGTCHYWDLSGAAARGFLMTIYCFLSTRRKEQIKAMRFLSLQGVSSCPDVSTVA